MSLDPALHAMPEYLGDVQATFDRSDGLGLQAIRVDTTSLEAGPHKLMMFAEGRRESDLRGDGSVTPYPDAQLAALLILYWDK